MIAEYANLGHFRAADDMTFVDLLSACSYAVDVSPRWLLLFEGLE